METKELKINIPEGYEIDKEKSTFEKIVFKKKENSKPRSWEEYLELNLNTGFDGCGIDYNRSGGVERTGLHHRGKAIVPNNLAVPFIAMMQLMSLRQVWIDDWKSVWDGKTNNYCISIYDNEYNVDQFARAHQALSFPTREMAVDFMNCFKDLLEKAKSLL